MKQQIDAAAQIVQRSKGSRQKAEAVRLRHKGSAAGLFMAATLHAAAGDTAQASFCHCAARHADIVPNHFRG